MLSAINRQEEKMMILRSLKERCAPRWAALLVVDVQNDFVSSKGSAAQRGEDVSAAQAMEPTIIRLIAEARRVALPVIYVKTTHSEWTDTPSWMSRNLQQTALNT